MSFTRRSLFGLAATVGLAIAAPALASAETITVGAYPSNPPFEFKNASGAFEGFEVDIVTEVAKRLGMDVEISDLGFQALFAATSSQRIDTAISSITITAERLQSQSFTQPYYDADMGIATRADSDVSGTGDLQGKILGGLSGSTGEAWIKENQTTYGIAEVKGYNAQQDLLLDLAAGRIDAAVSDVPGMEYAFTRMKDLVVKERISTGEQYAMMMTKDHPLLEKVNDALSEMKTDGTMATIHEKWFGTAPPEGSSTATVMPIPTP
ncbi:MAG TPA: ABC transporter substrate-binding protein [Methylomirabilota bacterium]|nr:ABC transporter substrate-binding protein [Methylomirabilota bacterium]